jgi:hypothetical protein
VCAGRKLIDLMIASALCSAPQHFAPTPRCAAAMATHATAASLLTIGLSLAQDEPLRLHPEPDPSRAAALAAARQQLSRAESPR